MTGPAPHDGVDQALSDNDQELADADQASARADQAASDRDQAASDASLADGSSSPAEHDRSREIRLRGTHEREHTAAARVQIATERDAAAAARDAEALERDQAATARDASMTNVDAALDLDALRSVSGQSEIVLRAGELRGRAARHRAQAAEHRRQAAADRAAAALDRAQAARDRRQALTDLEALAVALAATENDAVTGARTRTAGLADLERELERCRRTDSPLVVAYVDTVGLKHLNDHLGHQAGDRLLHRIVATIQDHLRPYDLVVRVGGHEFLCAMSSMTVLDARRRFGRVAAALADGSEPGSIRTGFAQLSPQETASELIARADDDLIASRRD